MKILLCCLTLLSLSNFCFAETPKKAAEKKSNVAPPVHSKEFTEKVVNSFCDILERPNMKEELKLPAIKALINWGTSDRAEQILTRLIKTDGNKDVRSEAAVALSAYRKNDRVRDTLDEVLRTDREPQVQIQTLSAILHVRELKSESIDFAIQLSLDALESTDDLRQVGGAVCLRQLFTYSEPVRAKAMRSFSKVLQQMGKILDDTKAKTGVVKATMESLPDIIHCAKGVPEYNRDIELIVQKLTNILNGSRHKK